MIMTHDTMARVMPMGNDLQRLIQATMQARGWNVRDLERATQRVDPKGKGVSYATLSNWVKPQGKRVVPRPDLLDLVARALGVDPQSLHTAARAAGGYRVETPEGDEDLDLELFTADYRKLSPEARGRLMRLVRNMMSDEDLFPKRRNGNGKGGRD